MTSTPKGTFAMRRASYREARRVLAVEIGDDVIDQKSPRCVRAVCKGTSRTLQAARFISHCEQEVIQTSVAALDVNDVDDLWELAMPQNDADQDEDSDAFSILHTLKALSEDVGNAGGLMERSKATQRISDDAETKLQKLLDKCKESLANCGHIGCALDDCTKAKYKLIQKLQEDILKVQEIKKQQRILDMMMKCSEKPRSSLLSRVTALSKAGNAGSEETHEDATREATSSFQTATQDQGGSEQYKEKSSPGEEEHGNLVQLRSTIQPDLCETSYNSLAQLGSCDASAVDSDDEVILQESSCLKMAPGMADEVSSESSELVRDAGRPIVSHMAPSDEPSRVQSACWVEEEASENPCRRGYVKTDAEPCMTQMPSPSCSSLSQEIAEVSNLIHDVVKSQMDEQLVEITILKPMRPKTPSTNRPHSAKMYSANCELASSSDSTCDLESSGSGSESDVICQVLPPTTKRRCGRRPCFDGWVKLDRSPAPELVPKEDAPAGEQPQSTGKLLALPESRSRSHSRSSSTKSSPRSSRLLPPLRHSPVPSEGSEAEISSRPSSSCSRGKNGELPPLMTKAQIRKRYSLQ